MFDDKTFNDAPTGYGRNYMPGGFSGVVVIEATGHKTEKESFKSKHSFFVAYQVNGKSYSWVVTIPENPGKDAPQVKRAAFDRALGNIKEFLSAVVGAEAFKDANHKEIYDMATSEANPFKGERLYLRTKERPTKAGGVYTVHDWRELTEAEK